MPPAGVLIGAAVAGIATGVGVALGVIAPTVLFGTALGAFGSGLFTFATSLVLGTLSHLLSPTPDSPSQTPFEFAPRERSTMVRQPITSRRIIYGEARVSGPMIYLNSTGNNKYHHIVIALADHEVEEIGNIYFGDDIIYSDEIDPTTGAVSVNRYENRAWIHKHLGTDDQEADANLVADVTEWTTDHRGRGVAYIYVKIEYHPDIYAGVIPKNIAAWVKGKKLYDTRTGLTEWSANPALCLYDYMTNSRYGRGADPVEVSESFTDAAANICDQFVTTLDVVTEVSAVDVSNDALEFTEERNPYQTGDRVQVTTTDTLPAGISAVTDYYVIVQRELYRGTEVQAPDAVDIKLATSYANALAGTNITITDGGVGTHTVTKDGEPRYTCNGLIDTAKTPKQIAEQLLTAMGGRIVLGGGVWRMYAAAYSASIASYTDTNVIGQLIRRGTHPRRERFNAVKGLYISPQNVGQPTDYPPIESATYLAQDDGRRRYTEYNLPFTTRSNTAQRLATILLKRHREQVPVEVTFDIEALEFQAGDTIDLTHTRRSWTSRDFEVLEWSLVVELDDTNAPRFAVKTALASTSSAIYSFDPNTDEVATEIAPVTSPLDPLNVAAPTGLTVTSGTDVLYLKNDGTVLSRIKIVWIDAADEFVDRYEIQYKLSADSDWQPSIFTSFGTTQHYIWDVQDGVAHDVRIRSINQLGVRSSWVTDTNHIVIGKSAVPGDVTNFIAQQNGDVVVMRYDEVGDLDLAGYEIRYVAQS